MKITRATTTIVGTPWRELFEEGWERRKDEAG